MNPLYYTERNVEIDGWEVNLTTYQLGGKWHTKADNVSPGAALARIVADTREEAEDTGLGPRPRTAFAHQAPFGS